MTSTPDAPVAPAGKPPRLSRHDAIRERAARTPGQWVWVDRAGLAREQARQRAAAIRRGLGRWAPAGTYDAEHVLVPLVDPRRTSWGVRARLVIPDPPVEPTDAA